MKKGENRTLRLAAASLILICIGIIYMWSVFGAFLIREFGWSTAESGLTASIMIGFFSIGGLVGGRVQDRIGPRKVVVAGSVAFAAGIFLASFAVALGPVPVYLSFGVLSGFAVGCIFSSAIACNQKWFPDRINVVMGVSVTCFGLASVIFSPIVVALATAVGIVATFRILAGLFLVLCLVGSVMIENPPKDWLPAGFERRSGRIAQDQYTLKQALRTPQLWIMFFTIWFLTAGFFTFTPILKQLALVRGLDQTMSTVVVMAIGLGLAAGRLVFPLVVNRVGRQRTAMLLSVIVLLATIGLVYAQGYAFLALVFLVAAGAGAPGAIWPTWTAENFGLANNGANYGFVLIGVGLSALLSFKIADGIAKATADGADSVYFVVAAAMAVLSIALIALFKPVKRRARPEQDAVMPPSPHKVDA